jgi:hypothetical protein
MVKMTSNAKTTAPDVSFSDVSFVEHVWTQRIGTNISAQFDTAHKVRLGRGPITAFMCMIKAARRVDAGRG